MSRRIMAIIFVDVFGVGAGNLALKLLITGALIGDPRVGLKTMRQKEREAGMIAPA